MREASAGMTFSSGGRLGSCHRNDANAADCSVSATTVQFVHVAAIVAVIFDSGFELLTTCVGLQTI